ncbi:hypothetical protein B7494_g8122 [Chlorociboria aeruginascens]|nr:hypothetical protein B7494_g8122 [Chlorociboria aeruginascens]
MSELPTRTFFSWDGLEEDDLADITSAVRDLVNTTEDTQKKKKRTPKSIQKDNNKIKEESASLAEAVEAWKSRPKPTTQRHLTSFIDNTECTRLRTLHNLIKDGLGNPILLTDPEFRSRLQELTCTSTEIGTIDSYEVEEAESEAAEVDYATLIDRQLLSEEASKIQFSPPPALDEMDDEDEENEEKDKEAGVQSVEEFPIDDDNAEMNEDDAEI